MKILGGSEALHLLGVSNRIPKDRDYFVTKDYIRKEGEDIIPFPNEILNMMEYVIIEGEKVATASTILTVKCSHLGWDKAWEKTKNDILFLKAKGYEIIPSLFDTLVKYWKEDFGNKDFLSLNKSKEDFFNDHVNYIYDHDYLHELVAFPNIPVYTECLKDGQDVLIDKSRFFSLPKEKQLRMFREEITVIAVERWVVQGYCSWFEAYFKALKKTILTLTKGWATNFLILNLDYFCKPDYEYFKHALVTLKLEDKMGESIFNEMFELYKEQTGQVSEENFKRALRCDYLDKNFAKKYNVKILDSKEGEEGGGEYCYVVFTFKDKIYRGEYRYYSYYGTDDDCFPSSITEVKPVTKTITVYE